MNKKRFIIIVLIIIIIAIGGYFFFFTGNNASFDKVSCAKEGQTIDAAGMPNSCCFGLKPLGGAPDGYDGDCSLSQLPTGLSICAPCGDGICNSNFEGKCNCPEDCAASKCGKEGETLGGKIDRCCAGLKPTALSEFGGMFQCLK